MNELRQEVSVPVIATRGIIIFPNQEIAIEVGREKSIHALNEARKNFDSHVLLVCQKDMMIDDPQPEDLYRYGTLCQIKQVRKKEGFYRVHFYGLQRAKLISLNDSDELMFADAEIMEDYCSDEMEEMALVRRIATELESASSQVKKFPPEVITQLTRGVSAPVLADQFAQYFPIPLNVKQQLLEETDINQRLLMILEQLETEKQLSEIENVINEKIKDRIDENQKEYYLREKLRALKEELGDVPSQESDSDELRRIINENPYPENIKKKALEELSRYETMPSASGESGVIRSYLDWLLKTPWYQMSKDNEDLNLAAARLDEDHFGLEKVKERILEYLAVKQITNSLNAPILCLVGPPGVGKTSLAKSIARCLDREFVKASLGGVHDEAEIRGHRRTYLGSMPGRIIQGLKKAGVKNPVFLLDELDKMASDYKGDPSSAMLEVLDPEQNKFFSDNYLEEPYDLSNVLFIATANYMENIPAALKDRLEIIELSSYTEDEKVHIAQDHLVAKQCQINGLKPNQFKISDELILYLIQYYTREAGVRQLERLLSSLCRKAVLSVVKENKKSIRITKKLINQWLGKERFDYGVKENENQIGVVTGLAYTSFGGDVLPVEVTYFEGKGKLVVTGQLGDVMKESAEIAMDYVKSNAKNLGISPDFFEKNDIHIHVPEGAVPKDGPSAGITLTTALVSALTNKAVYSNIAMTGEVTLRGNVLPIGGLKEKSMAAHRSGIDTILIPSKNVKDLDEVPSVVKDSVKFIPVESMDQVLRHALVR